MSTCELRRCKSGLEGTIRVGKNIGDSCFSVWICVECAECIDLTEGQDIPDDADAVNRKLRNHYKERI